MADLLDVARRHDDAFNRQDAETRLAIEVPDIDVTLPGGMNLHGSDQVIGVARIFWEALPDVRILVDDWVVSGDTVVSEGTLTGTHSGTFHAPSGDVPPSGNRVDLRFASFKRFRDGKLISEHLYYDQLEFLQQIGVMPG